MFFFFPISLGLAGPTGDNDFVLGRVWRLPVGCSANCRRFVVSSPFTLKTFQKERSIWIVFTIHLKVSSNTVGTWQWYDFSIITQLPNHARCPPSPQECDSGCLHSCPAAPWANSVSQFLAVWSVWNRKLLWMNGNRRLQEWESYCLANVKVGHPLSPTVKTHMTFHFSSF